MIDLTDYSLASAVETALRFIDYAEEKVTHTPEHIERWSQKATAEYADPESRFYFLTGTIMAYNFVLVITPPAGLNRMEQDAFFAGVVYGEEEWSEDNFNENFTPDLGDE